ncbi:hypothetical protein BZA05DRAFT_403714 [Tricharina praecox]|uniref:uncharacterized protein n=1 Tax=Tricharina praecox TaxID=43433 RepID=UPI00221F6CF5|nr:uncharacterized protein BZA05DRAFT_403714 [Tricharina praecox]KAI5848327.1 hypothetical protein BZA05DRAFT_403714 [Tricharina praecox]
MRRTVQSLVAARHLLLPPPSSPVAVSNSVAVRYHRSPTMTLALMGWGSGWVCADCRRHISTESSTSTHLSTTQQQRRKPGRRGTHTLSHEFEELGVVWDGATQRPKKRPHQGQTEDAKPTRARLGLRPLSEFVEDTMRLSPELPGKLRERVQDSFEWLRRESDVTAPSTHLLVDQPDYRRNWELWESLLVFRKRVYRERGVMDMWKGMRMREVDLPTLGRDSDILWGIFLETALKDDAFLEELIDYAHDLSERTNGLRQWSRLYDQIILHHLVNLSPRTLAWHWRLFPTFTSRSWARLFARATEMQPDKLGQDCGRKIHATVSNPRAYEGVIRYLCSNEQFLEALHWHRHFLLFYDLPPDSSAADELVAWTASTGSIRELQSLLWSLHSAGIKMVESTFVAAITQRRAPAEAIDMLLGPECGISIEAMGDTFWSALFETSLSPTEVFEYALLHGKGCVVGVATLWKAMGALDRGMKDTTRMLELAGLVVQLEVADLETLSSNASVQKPNPHFKPNETLQILLRTHQIRAALSFVQILQDRGIPLSSGSITLMVETLLRPRRPGKNPFSGPHIFPPGKDIDTVIMLLLSLHRSGTNIPPHTWSELFRRLGKTQRLHELERLIFALIGIYRRPNIPVTSKANPLRRVFGPKLLRALVEWGFLHQRKRTWGVTLVRKMRDSGVHVDNKSVARAVRVRARALDLEVQKAGELLKEVVEEWGEGLGSVEILMKDIEEWERLEWEREDAEWVGRESRVYNCRSR